MNFIDQKNLKDIECLLNRDVIRYRQLICWMYSVLAELVSALAGSNWYKELNSYTSKVSLFMKEEYFFIQKQKNELSKITIKCKICEHMVFLLKMHQHSSCCLEKQSLQKQLLDLNNSIGLEIAKNSLKRFKDKVSTQLTQSQVSQSSFSIEVPESEEFLPHNSKILSVGREKRTSIFNPEMNRPSHETSKFAKLYRKNESQKELSPDNLNIESSRKNPNLPVSLVLPDTTDKIYSEDTGAVDFCGYFPLTLRSVKSQNFDNSQSEFQKEDEFRIGFPPSISKLDHLHFNVHSPAKEKPIEESKEELLGDIFSCESSDKEEKIEHNTPEPIMKLKTPFGLMKKALAHCNTEYDNSHNKPNEGQSIKNILKQNSITLYMKTRCSDELDCSIQNINQFLDKYFKFHLYRNEIEKERQVLKFIFKKNKSPSTFSLDKANVAKYIDNIANFISLKVEVLEKLEKCNIILNRTYLQNPKCSTLRKCFSQKCFSKVTSSEFVSKTERLKVIKNLKETSFLTPKTGSRNAFDNKFQTSDLASSNKHKQTFKTLQQIEFEKPTRIPSKNNLENLSPKEIRPRTSCPIFVNQSNTNQSPRSSFKDSKRVRQSEEEKYANINIELNQDKKHLPKCSLTFDKPKIQNKTNNSIKSFEYIPYDIHIDDSPPSRKESEDYYFDNNNRDKSPLKKQYQDIGQDLDQKDKNQLSKISEVDSISLSRSKVMNRSRSKQKIEISERNSFCSIEDNSCEKSSSHSFRIFNFLKSLDNIKHFSDQVLMCGTLASFDLPRVKDFVVLSKIGKGAFGEVIKVQKKSTKDIFALKFIKIGDKLTPSQLKNLLIERDIFHKVDSDYVIKCYYSFIYKHYACFVMEFIDGGDMKNLLSEMGLFSESEARFYLWEIIQGIEYLHSQQIIHRDLKPANLLLTKKGHIKVADFGLSKILDKFQLGVRNKIDMDMSERLKLGVSSVLNKSIVGTPEYIPIELLSPEGEASNSIDWWAVGCILYEMVIGVSVFGGSSVQEVFTNILRRRIEWPPVGSEEGCVSAEFKDMVLRFLEEDPNKRLGASGVKEIRNHPFFHGFGFEKAECPSIRGSTRSTVECIERVSELETRTPNIELSDYLDLLGADSVPTDPHIEPENSDFIEEKKFEFKRDDLLHSQNMQLFHRELRTRACEFELALGERARAQRVIAQFDFF